MQRIDVVGYLTVEAEGDAFEPGRRLRAAATSGAASRASTTLATNSAAKRSGRPTRRCAGR